MTTKARRAAIVNNAIDSGWGRKESVPVGIASISKNVSEALSCLPLGSLSKYKSNARDYVQPNDTSTNSRGLMRRNSRQERKEKKKLGVV